MKASRVMVVDRLPRVGRGPATSRPAWTAAAARRAFSLLEVMIAIMILGIGTVMVATIFPVGLEISRQALQMDIAQATVDAATATLCLRVPGADDLTPLETPPAAPHARVLVPDPVRTEIEQGSAGDLPSALSEIDKAVLTLLDQSSAPIYYAFDDWQSGDPETDGQRGWFDLQTILEQTGLLTKTSSESVRLFVYHSRAFTERSGWAVDYQGNNLDNAVHHALPLPAQNLLAVTRRLVVEIPPGFNGLRRAGLPRLHVAERVYPPVSLTYIANPNPDPAVVDDPGVYVLPKTGHMLDPVTGDLVDWSTGQVIDAGYLGRLIAIGDPARDEVPRRYAWTAFHHRITRSASDPGVMVTIAVTHRPSTEDRYARQRERTAATLADKYEVDFDPDPLNLDDRADLLQPLPDNYDEDSDGAVYTDCLFPVPWLVMLREVNLGTGEIKCTAEVARLLPAESWFIVARTKGSALMAGTPHQVKKSEWSTDMLGEDPTQSGYRWATLQIAPGQDSAATDVLVWVFPPPIQAVLKAQRPDAPNRPENKELTFGVRSPVVGVALRRIDR